VRRLQAPTLVQWGCLHYWKTTTSRQGKDNLVRMHYLTCRRCDLKLKTEERPVVPWNEDNLVTHVKTLLPE
jgi:hypothetical protein